MEESLRRLEALEKDVAYHDIDLYRGRGKANPSITSRLDLLEDTVSKIGRNLNRIQWLLLTILAGLITEVVTKR